jgi:hydrogenase/urease accessory protein HupE
MGRSQRERSSILHILYIHVKKNTFLFRPRHSYAVRLLLAAALALWLAPVRMLAHGVTVAFAEIHIEDRQVNFRIHLPALDADQAFHIDTNGNGYFDPSELQGAAARVDQYLGGTVKVIQEGHALPATFGPLQIWTDPDGNPFLETTVTVPLAEHGLQQLTIACDLFHDLSPSYQTVGFITIAGRQEQFIFRGGAVYEASFATSGRHASLTAFGQFVRMGVLHIFTGYDHIAFLLGVVLIGGTFRSLVKIVTSFTVAHSITLALAALNIVSIPSRIVESGIALSIMYIALENLFFSHFDRRWMVTFFFGLVHGFGFASALREVRLPAGMLGTALFSFNLGVELGQVAIVAILLPLLWELGRTRFRSMVVRVAWMAIFFLGSFWFWQRVT